MKINMQPNNLIHDALDFIEEDIKTVNNTFIQGQDTEGSSDEDERKWALIEKRRCKLGSTNILNIPDVFEEDYEIPGGTKMIWDIE